MLFRCAPIDGRMERLPRPLCRRRRTYHPRQGEISAVTIGRLPDFDARKYDNDTRYVCNSRDVFFGFVAAHQTRGPNSDCS